MTEWKSECASESTQARESEAHFSERLLLPSLYFLRGKKKMGTKKKDAKIESKVQTDLASLKMKPTTVKKLKSKTRRSLVE